MEECFGWEDPSARCHMLDLLGSPVGSCIWGFRCLQIQTTMRYVLQSQRRAKLAQISNRDDADKPVPDVLSKVWWVRAKKRCRVHKWT